MSSETYPEIRLMIYDLDQIVKVCQYGQQCLRGPLQNGISVLQRDKGIGLSIVINEDGNIEYVDYDDKVPDWCRSTAKKLINGKGCTILPGLIDAHTHSIFAGDRCFEFDLKSRGETYMRIHEQGGGIYFTVRETNKASYEVLLNKLKETVLNMIQCGTTSLEIKTGYGLNYESELKQLQVANDVKKQMSDQVDVVITFLAHAVPENMSSNDAVSDTLAMMQRIKEEHPSLHVDFIDVFCERGVYNVEQTRRILLTGQSIFNCKLTVHGEELSHTGISEWCDILGVHSVSHGEFIKEKGILSMSNACSTLVLCPNTVHILKINPPPCRSLIKANVPIAIGTDYCPNAMCYSMPMAMHFAVMKCGLTINEALVASTINSAYALSISDRLGSLETGKQGDLLMLNCNDFRHLIYQFGDSRSLIKHVFKKGNIVNS